MAVHPSKRHDDLRGISLCAGVGGLDLGLHIAEPGYRTVGYVERNSFAAATLVARMADQALAPAPVWDDLRSFDGRLWCRRVHIVSAGYPCQPFSLAGHRQSDSDPRHLWPEVARIIGEIGPEWCFFENVPGHLSLGLDHVAADLQGLDYRVAACVLSAAEVGGSHIRERLFILAHADGQKCGKPRLPDGVARGPELPPRPESGWQADGDPDGGLFLDPAVGLADSDGLASPLPRSFPPLRIDLEDWGVALDARPDLKPCLQRLNDGLASGLDRTAAAGNGVVPLAASRAWRMLTRSWGALNRGLDSPFMASWSDQANPARNDTNKAQSGCGLKTALLQLLLSNTAKLRVTLQPAILFTEGGAANQPISPLQDKLASLLPACHQPRPALLLKSTDGWTAASAGQTCPTTFVTGMRIAVTPFRTATRIWNFAT